MSGSGTNASSQSTNSTSQSASESTSASGASTWSSGSSDSSSTNGIVASTNQSIGQVTLASSIADSSSKASSTAGSSLSESSQSSASFLIDQDNLHLEVTVPALSLSTTESTQLPAQVVLIECSLRAARVSPVLSRVISQYAPPSMQQSTDASKSSSSSSNTSLQARLINGSLVVRFPVSNAFNQVSVARVVGWMSYHILDEEFEKNCRFEYFDQDEFEREQQRLTELPCLYDWHFTIQLGGGETLQEHKRAEFFDVVLLAEYLGLEPLVLLCGKYICGSIRGKSVQDVRKILGLVNDLTKEEEAHILKANEIILGAPQEKRSEGQT